MSKRFTSKRELFQALVDGKHVRENQWRQESYLFFDADGVLVDQSGEDSSQEFDDYFDWELTKDTSGTAYYRRAWAKQNDGSITTSLDYLSSKEEFDKTYDESSYLDISDDWEVIYI